MTWILWVILALIAVAVWFGCRYETIHDNRRQGYVIYNDLFGYPCLDGRIFRTRRGAVRKAKKMMIQLPWVNLSIRRVL